MGVDDSLVSEVVRRVLSVARPEKIILFGSAAAGAMNEDSDVDLLVLEPNPRDPRRRSVLIGDALRGLGMPFDVIVMARQRFEDTKDIIGGIAYPASKLGRVIYDAA
jgi:predicted nucleotidyltransferase